MRIMRIWAPISRYYDTITIDTDDNLTYYYKPKVVPSKISNFVLNGVVIKADNPHIIIDRSIVKIIPYELNQDYVIRIDDLYPGDMPVDIRISINDKDMSIIISITKWPGLM